MPLLDLMRKKLREAQYFVLQMEPVVEREFGDAEEFAFLLSAFLSASRSITDPLDGRRYATWFQAWRDGRRPREQELLDFMRVQRNAEVHRNGAAVDIVERFVPIADVFARHHGDPAYGFQWWGPPYFDGRPPGEVGVNMYQFRLGGTQVEAYATCRDFVALLGELITAFEAAYPGP
jgi:hypothetical protein